MIGLITNKILRDSETLEELVSDRIFLLDVPQDQVKPNVVIDYQITPGYSASGLVNDEANVDIKCSARDYETAVKVGFVVRDTLELYQGVVYEKKVFNSRVINIVDEVDGEFNIYLRIITFLIKYR